VIVSRPSTVSTILEMSPIPSGFDRLSFCAALSAIINVAMNGGYYQQQGSFDPFAPYDNDQQQKHSAYGGMGVDTSNNPYAEDYDPGLGSAQTYSFNPTTLSYPTGNPGQHLLMSVSGTQFARGTPRNVTVINHLNFSSPPLIADTLSQTHAFDPIPYSLSSPGSSQFVNNSLEAEIDPLLLMSSSLFSNPSTERFSPVPPPAPTQTLSSDCWKQVDESEIADLRISIDALSMEPLSGPDVTQQVRSAVDDVLSCYIPCVAFLVQCQQDLRKGLSLAQQKRTSYGSRCDGMSPQQFFISFVDPLPNQFHRNTKAVMGSDDMDQALDGLRTLVSDAQRCQGQGCEAVKNAFLGGMKDGQSWGLRKWLSTNGKALTSCTLFECLLSSVKKLPKDDKTRKLASIMGPPAQNALARLRGDIPKSYQEVSSAHPFLPFFHRLEAALKGIAQFDPDDDDVICLDDSSDEEADAKPAPPVTNRKRNRTVFDLSEASPVTNKPQKDDSSSSGESDAVSVVEIVEREVKDTKPCVEQVWECANCKLSNGAATQVCATCLLPRNYIMETHAPVTWPKPIDRQAACLAADNMAENVERLADVIECQPGFLGMQSSASSFWDGSNYSKALRFLVRILRSSDSMHFVDRVEEDKTRKAEHTSYNRVIKHPLSFRDIVGSLLLNEEDELDGPPNTNDGKLPNRGLSSWNMWHGMDLLQAIDLVFLNSLAFGKVVGEGKSKHRSATNKLRKSFWSAITKIVDDEIMTDAQRKRDYMPTRRSESSGFVIYKGKGGG